MHCFCGADGEKQETAGIGKLVLKNNTVFLELGISGKTAGGSPWIRVTLNGQKYEPEKMESGGGCMASSWKIPLSQDYLPQKSSHILEVLVKDKPDGRVLFHKKALANSAHAGDLKLDRFYYTYDDGKVNYSHDFAEPAEITVSRDGKVCRTIRNAEKTGVFYFAGPPTGKKAAPGLAPGRYVMEVSSILKSLSEEDHNEWKDFAPIGCYKFSGYITYSGNNISSIFGGLVEDLIYKLYKDKKDLDDKEIEEKLKSTLYNNFMNKFLSTYYNNTTKRGLIEDYLMKTKYFDYVDRYNDNKERYSYIVAKIRNLIGNSISFLGNISEFELVNSIKIFNNDISFTDQVYNSDSSKNLTTMLSEINTSIANKADATDLTELETKINNLVTGAPETNDTLLEISQYIEEHQDEYDDLPSENEYYFVVSSDLITYLLLKNFMTNINVVAFESMDQIYSDKEMKIQSNLRVITTHGTRLNIMISKNKTIREIITKDTDSQLGLSMPYNRYGLMLSYQRIKYLVKLTNANPEDLLSDHFVSQKDSIFTRYRNLVSDLVSMRDSITRSYLKMES